MSCGMPSGHACADDRSIELDSGCMPVPCDPASNGKTKSDAASLTWLWYGLGSLLFFVLAILNGGAVFLAIEKWRYRDACWFSMTLFSTVGYGNFAPATTGGKVWVIIFSTLTIPPTPFCLNYVSNMMVNLIALVVFPGGLSTPVSTRMRLAIGTMGLIMHLLVCGGLAFALMEDWNYGDAVYYSFVTLTTIGLGDFAPVTATGQYWSMFFVVCGLGIISLMIEDVLVIYFGQEQESLESEVVPKACC